MMLMSKEEANHTLNFEELDNVLLLRDQSQEFDHLSCSLPKEASVLQILAERLAYMFCRESECWVYVTDWNARPTSMFYDLFYGYRSGRGDQRLLAEAPVYNFVPNKDVRSFMSILSIEIDALIFLVTDAWIFALASHILSASAMTESSECIQVILMSLKIVDRPICQLNTCPV